jgi:alpha-methylacyl-CoA racemase
MMDEPGGALAGIRVLEIGGIGPGPHCGMLLGDMGAKVLRIDRGDADPSACFDLLNRNKQAVTLDLKTGLGVATVRRLAGHADILIEGYRPGVMERLGLGPDVLLAEHPRLVYGRVTGWGQDGPLAQAAGHDLNFIALTGVLHAMGIAGEPPPVPLNTIGDFGGGSLYLTVGILAALHHAQHTGVGQVVDCAIVDGVNHLMAMQHGMLQSGFWTQERGANLIDGGAPFYGVYETSDQRYVSVAAVEPKFFVLLLEHLGFDAADLPAQYDRAAWPALRKRFAEIFAAKTRDQWCALLEGSESCFAPVLDFNEARDHPHNRARKTMVEAFGLSHPAPAPRFSVTPASIRLPPVVPGARSGSVLSGWGFTKVELTELGLV